MPFSPVESSEFIDVVLIPEDFARLTWSASAGGRAAREMAAAARGFRGAGLAAADREEEAGPRQTEFLNLL